MNICFHGVFRLGFTKSTSKRSKGDRVTFKSVTRNPVNHCDMLVSVTVLPPSQFSMTIDSRVLLLLISLRCDTELILCLVAGIHSAWEKEWKPRHFSLALHQITFKLKLYCLFSNREGLGTSL